MNPLILEKLQWPILIEQIVAFSRSAEGQEALFNLKPDVKHEELTSHWDKQAAYQKMISDGYKLPLDDLANLNKLLRLTKVGQMLNGIELRQVFDLLESSSKLFSFSEAMKERYPILRFLHNSLLLVPKLTHAISSAILDNGELSDTASPELQRIRKNKLSLTKKIEEKLTALIHNSDLVPYLQDDFYTKRNERYVLPLKLDSRGRVEGKIVDTSDSGQTLFCEPNVVGTLNDQLTELELQEKLEIIRIFRELSAQVHLNTESLQLNYRTLVEADITFSKALYSYQIQATIPTLVEKPCIHLIGSRHPLLNLEQKSIVKNDITTNDQQKVLIISGPNAGGKTVVLKTVGLLHLMAKAGLLIPAEKESKFYDFKNYFLEMGDSQNIQTNLSTFSAHLIGLKPILEQADKECLVLLDEVAVGTDPQTGSAIAQALVENLAEKSIYSVVTTHFDNLKTLALNSPNYRNGSMEYSIKNYKPTFHLIWDLPGQSFGLELAEQIGLPSHIIHRAKALRGSHLSSLDEAISKYLQEREKFSELSEQLTKEKLALESTRDHFEREKAFLQQERQQSAKKYAEIYRSQLSQLQEDFELQMDSFKKMLQESETSLSKQDLQQLRQTSSVHLDKIRQGAEDLEIIAGDLIKLPGKACEMSDLKLGDRVYILPMQAEGQVAKTPAPNDESIEIQFGMLKLNSAIHDLRLLSQTNNDKNAPLKNSASNSKNHKHFSLAAKDSKIIRSSSNTLDVRGTNLETAYELALSFIDRAIMRGDSYCLILHGHGTGSLKQGLRQKLSEECPYAIKVRPGSVDEGGDALTVVTFSGP